MNFALDNFQEKEIVRLSVPEGITTVEVEITLPLGVEYAEGTAVITKGEAKIIQKAGTLLSQPTFVVTINKSNTITFEFNKEVTSQALLLKGELKDTVKLKVGERLYDTKLSNSYYLHSPSLLLQPSPIVFDKKDGEHNDFFVLSNTGIGGVKDIYFSVDYPKEVSLIDLKYKGKKILPIGVVPAGYANAGAPLYRVEGTFFKEKKDRIIIYEHYTVTNCQANCPIKYATYWGDNILHFYETKEEIKLLHPKKEPTIITLLDDTYTITTTESTTTTTTIVGSVFTNDSMNGKPIDIQKVIFSLLPQSTPNTFIITKDGNIIVPPQTPIGRYTLNYRICDNSQTSKSKNHKLICQTATVTIAILQSVTTPTTTTSTTVTATITPTVITLSDDTYTITTTESATTTATTVGSVFTNDRLNGKPIDIQKVIFSLLPQSTPNTFIITKDGNIIVPPQTPIGRYTLNYRICDNSQTSKDKNHKPICQIATVTIVVLQSVTTPTTATSTTVTTTTTIVTPTVITLSDDTYNITTTESTTTTATTVGSVFTNDCLNGKPIDIQKVIFSLLPQSTPNTFIITKDGNIIVPSHTPIGRYTLNYRICDNSQTSKDKNHKPICQIATVTIVVRQTVTTPTTTTSTTTTATVITPTILTLSDDTYTLTITESTTTTATTVGSVFTNDRLNGKPINIQKVIFSLLPQSTPISFVITKNGNIIVPPHTPIGRYILNYSICDNSQTSKEKNQKPVCQTATVTIAVLQSVTTPTTATNTTVTATTTPTIITPTVITLSDDTYTLTTTESTTTTTATTVGSVFSNDSMNGKPIDIQKVIFSLLPQSTPNTFIITKYGNIIVPPHTPIGRYILNYRICDNSQPSKSKSQKPICQTATVTIAVLQSVTTPTTATSTTVTATTTTPTVITLSDDTYTLTTTHSTTTTATTVGSVFTNDRLNGKPIDIQKVIFSLLPQSTPNTFIITKDGNIIVPSQTPIGRYTLNYRICDNSQTSKDKNFKPVCQTATVTIVVRQTVTTPTTATNTTTSTTVTTTTTPTIVTPTVITLSDDTYTLTTTESTTTTATTVGSVFTNDRMNGKPIDIQKVIFSLLPQSTPNTFVITKDGNIIVPSHTPIGHYILNYRICDSSQPLKNKSQKPVCQTATVTIAVLQSVTTPTIVTPTIITLSDDTYTVTTTESTTTTATTVGSVFANDRLNGKPIDIQKVIFSLLPQSTPTSFVITKDGNIIVPAQTPIGRYTLNYRICDNSQPSKNKNFKPVCQTATVTIVVLQSVTTPTTVTNTTTSTTVTATTTPTVVTPTIITLSDDTYTLTTTASTTTTATTVGSVFANDRMNGKPIDIQKVIFSLLPQSTPTSFVITKDGNIIVPAQTLIGRYTLNYRICDNSQPSKDKNYKPICKTVTVTIAVLQSVTTPTTNTPTTVTSTTITATITPTVITLSDDTYTITTTESTTTSATTVGSVFSNDRMNGKPIDIQKVIFSLLPQSSPNTFVITKNGNIIVPSHTPIGRYILNYRICDNSQTLKNKNQKLVCQIATVTIAILQSVTTPTTATSTTVTATTTPTVVTPTVITLSDDTYTVTTTASTTTTATTVGSVFSNDRLNGKPIDIQKVIFSLLPQSTPTSFIITKDGNIIIPPQTPIGHYTLNYRICDNSQPSKDKNYKPICQTATVTIAILQSVTTPTVITLSDDTYTVTTTESTTTTATTVGSVFTNDRLNGKPIDIQKVIFSLL
ncbi:hypothetical protein, partial [Capnocytophaga leadbetteri]